MTEYELVDARPEKPFIVMADGEELSEHATRKEAEKALETFIREEAWEYYADGPEWNIQYDVRIVKVIERRVLRPKKE